MRGTPGDRAQGEGDHPLSSLLITGGSGSLGRAPWPNTARRRFLTPEQRFLDSVEPEPTSGCWIWMGPRQRYGHFWLGKVMSAHRASWILFRGEIPAGQQVCHRCDNTACANPGHLFLGSQLENRQDAVHKGRAARGDRIGNSVVTPELAATIKAASAGGEGATSIARRLGLKRVTVSAIVTGRNWRHI